MEAGHQVIAFDPVVKAPNAQAAAPGIQVVESALDSFRGTDAVVIATEWPEFAALDLTLAHALARRAVLFDGRNLLDPDEVQRSGFLYRGVGRPQGGGE
jgi:UDPglucose 6-dehydrogenase